MSPKIIDLNISNVESMLIFARENKSYFKGLGSGLGLDGDFDKSSLKNWHFSQCKK